MPSGPVTVPIKAEGGLPGPCADAPAMTDRVRDAAITAMIQGFRLFMGLRSSIFELAATGRVGVREPVCVGYPRIPTSMAITIKIAARYASEYVYKRIEGTRFGQRHSPNAIATNPSPATPATAP